MAKRRLITTLSLAELRPLGHQGTMAIAAYQQLVGLLATRLPAHVDLLAEPVADAGITRIDWYTRLEGEMVGLLDVSPDEQASMRGHLDVAFAEIGALADQLTRSGDRHRETVGAILRCALTCAPENVFVIGGKPVCTGWGCTASQVRGEATTLTRFVQPDTGAVEVQSITRHGAVPQPRVLAAAPPGSTAAAGVAVGTVGAVAVVARRWPWWPLWLLLGFLAVTLVVFALPALAHLFPDHGAALAAEQQQEAILRQELGQLRADLAGRRSACAAPDTDRRRADAGGKTGVVTVTLTWDNSNDLDLIVLSPADEVLFYKPSSRRSASGGELDVDANFQNIMPHPVENVVWTGDAPRGTYRLFVEHSGSKMGPPVPTAFKVVVTVAGKAQTFTSTARPGGHPDGRYLPSTLKALKPGEIVSMSVVGSINY